MFLGGCAGTLAECPWKNTEATVSMASAAALPPGCRTTSDPVAGVGNLVCSDGRVGFMFPE